MTNPNFEIECKDKECPKCEGLPSEPNEEMCNNCNGFGLVKMDMEEMEEEKFNRMLDACDAKRD